MPWSGVFFLAETLLDTLEQFFCALFGLPCCDDVNEARYHLFCLRSLSEFCLPPCRDALLLHCQHAIYQAALWHKALQNKIDAPSPSCHGWIIEGSYISIRWTTLNEAPPELMQAFLASAEKAIALQSMLLFCQSSVL